MTLSKKIVSICEPVERECIIHHDSNVASGDRPDWRLEDKETFGVYAYGDHKDLRRSGPYVFSQQEKNQFLRYLKLGRPVFIFDGIEFIFLLPEQDPFKDPLRLSLVSKKRFIQK